jgi:hypothetical protein
MIQVIDFEVCIPPADGPEIGLKCVVGKNRKTINTR